MSTTPEKHQERLQDRLLAAVIDAAETASWTVQLNDIWTRVGKPNMEKVREATKQAVRKEILLKVGDYTYLHKQKAEIVESRVVAWFQKNNNEATLVMLVKEFTDLPIVDVMEYLVSKGGFEQTGRKHWVRRRHKSRFDPGKLVQPQAPEVPAPAAEEHKAPLEPAKNAESAPPKSKREPTEDSPYTPGSARSEIYALLRAKGPMYVEEIGRTLGLDTNQIRKQISTIVRDGYADPINKDLFEATTPENPGKQGPVRARILYLTKRGEVFDVRTIAAVLELEVFQIVPSLGGMPEMQRIDDVHWKRLEEIPAAGDESGNAEAKDSKEETAEDTRLEAVEARDEKENATNQTVVEEMKGAEVPRTEEAHPTDEAPPWKPWQAPTPLPTVTVQKRPHMTLDSITAEIESLLNTHLQDIEEAANMMRSVVGEVVKLQAALKALNPSLLVDAGFHFRTLKEIIDTALEQI